MQRFVQIILLFYCHYLTHCEEPYFPSQIVFTVDNGQRLYAIDQVNQRAFVSINDTSPQSAYVYQHFPYAPAGTPQSKSYVQLAKSFDSNICDYATYWEYSGNPYNYFPTHWSNKTSFQILNYLYLPYTMIYSSTKLDADEDYWYSQELCYGEVADVRPCFQIYFQKTTGIPLRSIELQTVSNREIFQTTDYQVISVGKPDDKYFADIPKNWFTSCTDISLEIKYVCGVCVIGYEHYKNVSISLSAPPHRVNGNDSVTITWSIVSGCTDCITWTPAQLTFNTHNFNQQQNLTFYRKFDSRWVTLKPKFIGGGFDHVSPDLNAITFIPS